MPDPFRHYEGVPVIDLPPDPSESKTPMLDVLGGSAGAQHSEVGEPGPSLLSQLLFYSAAISASKNVPALGYRYALRVNPSSGNLHPTEFHFVARGLCGWEDGLYHYRPSSHMAEQRGTGRFALPVEGDFPIIFVLTSIAWREAWKYGARAYRYCLHDIGHAWQAVALSARALGWEAFAIGCFPDDEVARLCRLNDDEWPMLLVGLKAAPVHLQLRDAALPVWFSGQANQLSAKTICYSLIDGMHAAAKVDSRGGDEPGDGAVTHIASRQRIMLPAPAKSARPFAETVRKRRSAVDFVGGSSSMTMAQLAATLAAAAAPLYADFARARFIRLYIYAHRVEGMEPGVFLFREERCELELVRSGDQRVAAAGLSLGQELAGNACITFSMIGDLDRAARVYGDRGYRFVHFEAGAIGHRLYLAAEALGLGATGIGAFYDDEVHRYLNLVSEDGQVVYHFAIGYPAPDLRVSA